MNESQSQPIEAEVMPTQSQALAVRQDTGAVAPPGLFGAQEPVAIIAAATNVATALKGVIVKQGLISRISGKEYPKCEAWTLLGTMLGVFPVLSWTKQVDDGWEARVEARTRDGSVVGAAEAQCLRGERNWKDRDDFALRSMAQTRATAKCLRMPLGFVMTLAGYEPTPAEEMVADHAHQAPPTRQAPASPARPPSAPQTPPRQPAPAAATPRPLPLPTAESRAKMIVALKAGPGEPNRDTVTEYFLKCENPSQLMPGEPLEALPLRFVPATTAQMRALADKIAGFGNGEPAAAAFPAHDMGADFPEKPKSPGPKATSAPTKPIEVPRDPVPDHDQDAWRQFPMPWGKEAGVPLEELEKNYLFGLWANYTVETEYKGKPKKPETIAKDQTFRAMLDLAGKHYEFKKPD